MLSLLEAKGMQANAMLKVLEETFPPTNPAPNDPYEYIMYKAGQRSVVEWIYNYLEENG